MAEFNGVFWESGGMRCEDCGAIVSAMTGYREKHAVVCPGRVRP